MYIDLSKRGSVHPSHCLHFPFIIHLLRLVSESTHSSQDLTNEPFLPLYVYGNKYTDILFNVASKNAVKVKLSLCLMKLHVISMDGGWRYNHYTRWR
jgi:hypothetical protein